MHLDLPPDLIPVVRYSLERERRYYARRARSRAAHPAHGAADAWRAARLAEAIAVLAEHPEPKETD